jgi:ribose-phosphate pyrophosphokinase
MLLVSGPGSEEPGRKIADLLGVETSTVEHRFFPDGESYIRLTTEVRGRDVVMVHSTASPQDTRMVQLLLALDAIREGGAKGIIVVTPYLAYARQDRRRLPGEAVSVLTVARLFFSLGASKLITVNVHNPEVFEDSELDLHDLSGIPLLANYFKEMGLEGAFSLSLGKKPVDLEHARDAAAILEGGYGRLETFRDPATGEVSLWKAELEIEDRRVVIFDDVVTSGRTHTEAARFLMGRGADEVHLACVHSLLTDERLDAVLEEVDSFVCTDTIPNRFSRVNIAPLIAGALA